jgi:peroxiredoxin
MRAALLVPIAILLAPAALADGEVYKWVDKNGQVHISTTPPPKGAKAPPDNTPPPTYLYQWTDARGQYHITTTAPPDGAKLVEKVRNRTPPAGPQARDERSPAGTAPVTLAGAPNNGLTVQGLRGQRAVGARAPDLGGYNASGDEVSLADLRGQPVWINFATKFCRFCAAEAKLIARLEEEMKDVRFLTVLGVDGEIRVARKWAERYGLDPAGVLAGTPDVFPMGAVPHNVFIDRAGRVAAVHTGRLSEDAARTFLQPLR